MLAFDVLRADAQRRFPAIVSEQLQQFGHLLRLLDAEFKHRACGAVLAQDGSFYAESCIDFLGKGCHTLIFGLKYDAPVVKIFTKAGHRISRRYGTAAAGQLAAQNFVFYVLRKTHSSPLRQLVRCASRCWMLG